MSAPVRAVVLGGLLLLTASHASALEVRFAPVSPRQGDLVMVFLTGAGQAREVKGSLGEWPLHFFPYGGEHAALAGIDLESTPGKTAWQVRAVDALGAARRTAGSVVIAARPFPVQRLTLPAPMVDLDPETERRVAGESARLRQLYATISPERFWQ